MTNNKLIFKDLKRIKYQEALHIQENLFQELVQNKLTQTYQNLPHSLIFCEHYPVYTLGKSGKIENLLLNEITLKEKNIEFYQTNRGGDITFHGFGQLTIYPIFDLEKLKISLREYIFLLEELVIQYIQKFDIKGERLKNASGVWVNQHQKICAVGVKSSRMITMHGLGFNINTDLSYFDFINPCGFEDKGVCSIASITNQTIDFEQVKQEILLKFIDFFGFVLK